MVRGGRGHVEGRKAWYVTHKYVHGSIGAAAELNLCCCFHWFLSCHLDCTDTWSFEESFITLNGNTPLYLPVNIPVFVLNVFVLVRRIFFMYVHVFFYICY